MVTATDRRRGTNTSARYKNPVVVAGTGNLALSGEQTIDGVAVVADDRVFAPFQTDTTEIGIYDVSTGAWTRSADWSGAYDVVEGTLVPVSRGSVYANRIFRVTNTGSIVVDTTAITLDSFSDKPRTYTTAEIEAVGGEVNTTHKVTGLMIYNTTTNKPVWADGSSAASVWVDATGATAHSPT